MSISPEPWDATGRLLGGHALGEGSAATAILETAKRRRAAMIVLGTHGRTGIKRLLLGSVAERVVRTSSVPVMTVAGR